jgi:transposase-like protein
MELQIGGRTCPECGSYDYQFRNRKKVAEEGKGEAVETKYRCKACGHEWRVRVSEEGSGAAGSSIGGSDPAEEGP